MKKYTSNTEETKLNNGLFVSVRCQCGYCQVCKNDATIYDECEGCYNGKHPHLPKIQWDFENYMDEKFKEKLRLEPNPRIYRLIRNTIHSNGLDRSKDA